MGYTHYWTQKRTIEPEAWRRIIADVGKIIEHCGVELVWEYDEPNRKPQLDAKAIRFNGVGEDGHETFLIERKLDKSPPRYKGDNPNWNFCKTAQKPYDLAVTAVLAYLESEYPDVLKVTSDGERDDWQAGIDLAKDATDRVVRCPEGV